MVSCVHVKRDPADRSVGIGAAVASVLDKAEKDFGYRLDVIAVVPCMLAFFAACPERHEIVEADIIVRVRS